MTENVRLHYGQMAIIVPKQVVDGFRVHVINKTDKQRAAMRESVVSFLTRFEKKFNKNTLTNQDASAVKINMCLLHVIDDKDL